MKYLYGASIQGIQDFIFQTNKLKDIIGASELVKNVCDQMFEDEFRGKGEIVVSAAGNIKCIYDDEAECCNAVLKFPKRVMERVPGITISQAVVPYEASNFHEVCDKLEKRLKSQRSCRPKNLLSGLMIIERSRTTGLPAVCVDKNNGFLDECTLSKRKALGKDNITQLNLFSDFFGKYDKELVLDFKSLTQHNEWIAIVHADGNALGQVVARKSHNPKELRQFSLNLDNATKSAAQKSCNRLKEKGVNVERAIRPIILGGDDLTVVCSADIAVEFVHEYLELFEIETQEQIGSKLTACAGVAFIKSTYPFHYGYQLAESLCSEAKKDAKSELMISSNNGVAPSCLMFHKVQSSFVEDFVDIKTKELVPQKGISYCNGPYYLKSQEARNTIKELLQLIEQIDKEENNNVKSSIRRWLSDVSMNSDLAEQKQKRTLSLLSGKQKELFQAATKATIEKNVSYYLAYDLLALHTVKQQCTK